MLSCLVPVLFAFSLQGVLKFKCKIPAPKRLNGLVRFAERRNLVSVRVPSHFKRSLPTNARIILIFVTNQYEVNVRV